MVFGTQLMSFDLQLVSFGLKAVSSSAQVHQTRSSDTYFTDWCAAPLTKLEFAEPHPFPKIIPLNLAVMKYELMTQIFLLSARWQ